MKKIKKRQLLILLPGKDKNPMGGYKVAYQYADHFAEKYEVHILYNHCSEDFFEFKKFSIIEFLKKTKTICGYIIKKTLKKYHAGEWYKFKNKIKKDFLFIYKPYAFRKYKKDSIVFATALSTSYSLANIKRFNKKNCFYLIQDYEKWNGVTDEYVMNSYKLGLSNIVISDWLEDVVKSTSFPAYKVYNGLDFDYFKMSNPIENRKPYEVAMLYHTDDRKRCVDSFEALKIVKEKIPELHVNIFGTPNKPDFLPDWYTYYKTPNKEQHNLIYNNAAIFVAASDKEGFGLTPAEAMQCGSAVVCTAAGGFLTFAKNNETALTSPVLNPKALAENIIKLIQDNNLRITIAKNGHEFIKQFTMERAYNTLDKIIEEHAN